MRLLYLAALSAIAPLTAACDLRAQPADQRATTAWVQNLASQYDDLPDAEDARIRFRQDRFLARMGGLPAGDELQKLAGDLVSRVGYQELVLTLPAYGPLWKGNVFQAERFAVLVSRARQLTPERMRAWGTALSTATGNSDMGPAYLALDVLDTDPLFSPDAYREAVAVKFMDRLKSVPAESVNALAETVGLGRGQAAMYIISAEWAFSGTEFQSTEFARALEALRKAVPPTK